jgi:hypothetical protein
VALNLFQQTEPGQLQIIWANSMFFSEKKMEKKKKIWALFWLPSVKCSRSGFFIPLI